MVRLGGTASASHMEVFKGLETLFRRRGIDLDWVLYSDYDTMVEAFVKGEIDLAWNGPLSYVKIKRQAADACRVIAMRDVDVNFTTHFITKTDSNIITVEDLKDRTFAFGRRSSVQAGLLAYSFLKDSGSTPGKTCRPTASTTTGCPRPSPTSGTWLSASAAGSSMRGR